jgi:hypothetical protein
MAQRSMVLISKKRVVERVKRRQWFSNGVLTLVRGMAVNFKSVQPRQLAAETSGESNFHADHANLPICTGHRPMSCRSGTHGYATDIRYHIRLPTRQRFFRLSQIMDNVNAVARLGVLRGGRHLFFLVDGTVRHRDPELRECKTRRNLESFTKRRSKTPVSRV